MPGTIKLVSSDEKEFIVDRSIFGTSKTLINMFASLSLNKSENQVVLPISVIDSQTIEKVIEWCEHHKNDEILDEPVTSKRVPCILPGWDNQFLNDEPAGLMRIIRAANFLDIPKLLDYACQAMANMITDTEGPEQVREKFKMENDFDEKEYAELQKENDWTKEPVNQP